MWRVIFVPAVVATLLASGAGASETKGAIGCRSATPFDQSAPLGHAVRVGKVLWLAAYPFQSGYPTKTIVMAQRRISQPVVLRGWYCASGSPLRFSYRGGLPFKHVPVTATELRRTGGLSAAFGPWPARAVKGGYLMFWTTGLWKIVAYQDGRQVGTAIVRAASY